ncbi:MAG: cupin domain-containing protein [Marivirga sp.]|nr:cupin domain-containing protein [Marivirga sp.]
MIVSKDISLSRIRETNQLFLEVFRHGTLSVEVYKPLQVDLQKPHTRDEVYVVIDGSGNFFCGGQWSSFAKGDLLFVPAGVEHRFKDFTDDFSTWVIFYGPEGGEAPKQS